MRRLALTNKKVRGVRRRLRVLAKWAAAFEGRFPAGLTAEERFLDFKIPVLSSLVEGRRSTLAVQRVCAQRLIDACTHLINAKPSDLDHFRVTAVVCLPDMFASRVCIFSDEQSFQDHIRPVSHEFGSAVPIAGRRLSAEWGLILPQGMQELGVTRRDQQSDGEDVWYTSEDWFFGEVL
jgi:Protein of unknown function (DUF3916)